MRYSMDEVRGAAKRILAVDPELKTEITRLVARRKPPPWLAKANTALRSMMVTAGQPDTESAAPKLDLESIVQRVGRPVLAIQGGDATVDIANPESAVWADRIRGSARLLHPAISAVGRIDVKNFPLGQPYLGTGWLIDTDVIVTNRHVALEFAQRGESAITFQIGFDQTNPIGVDVDFLEEIGSAAKRTADIKEILFISPDNGPDVAFLRIARLAGSGLPAPLKLATTVASAKTVVAIIGYPARDPRIPDQSLMQQLFGDVFDKKRLAPGFITGLDAGALTHDCTTLGGNSGSPVINFATGEALALHFAGVFMKSNYAVPAPVLTTLLRQARESIATVNASPNINPNTLSPNTAVDARQSGATMTSQQATFVIPLQITVSIGTPTSDVSHPSPFIAAIGSGGPATSKSPPPPVAKAAVEHAVAAARAQLARRPDVVAVEPGFRFTDGWITDERCVVISVKQKYSLADLELMGLTPLPGSIEGVPTDVAVAPIADSESFQLLRALEGTQRAIVCNYKPRPGLPLNAVEEKMTITAHASPDAGWPVLEKFFARVKSQLTVGMYEFTAPHIVTACKAAVKPAKRRLSLVLQNRDEAKKGTTADDFTEQETVDQLNATAGKRISFAWASVSGPDRLFNTSYHIKVAVRDQTEMWLSSGSWRSSNQPPFDPIADGDQSPSLLQSYDRDWHLLVDNDALATLYDKYLLLDQKEASALQTESAVGEEPSLWLPDEYVRATSTEARVAPKYQAPLAITRQIRVQPLLTPDNYAEHVIALIKSAKKTLYFQNQSLDAKQADESGDAYQELLNALLAKQQQDGLDVRIIFRRFPTMRDTLTALKDYGFDTSIDRIRPMTNCHTKGIIVDGETVLVGSHNWTRSGTAFNRDASLILYDAELAQYYQNLFLYDWTRIAGNRVDESLPAMQFVRPEEGITPPGTVRVPLAEILGE